MPRAVEEQLAAIMDFDLGTYGKSHAPYVDWIAPLNMQECLRSSIHDWHDVVGMGARAKPGFPKIRKQ